MVENSISGGIHKHMMPEKKQILTVKNIRNVNIGNILQSILRNQNTTRSILAQENHISLMTVKHVVDDLIAAEILTEKESCSADVGRKPKVLEVSENYGNIVCVNLTSKDEISFLIYDIHEQLLAEQQIPLNEKESYRDQLTAAMEAARKKAGTVGTETVGIAVFVPSAYDENVDLVNYDLIPDFKELHIRSLFQKKFGINNILILHDVFAAARSEYDSLNPQMESQFYFYCGYGVGGCFIHKDEAVAGEEKMAGEVGKMILSMDGSQENSMTLEEAVSVSAIKKKMKDCGIEMHFSQLLELYHSGEPWAVEFLTPALNTVSRVLYNLLWVYNPTRIVIDSCKNGYSLAIAEHFGRFMEQMRDDAIPIHVQIRQAKYDEYHMMRGCFHMARNAWIEEIAGTLQ